MCKLLALYWRKNDILFQKYLWNVWKQILAVTDPSALVQNQELVNIPVVAQQVADKAKVGASLATHHTTSGEFDTIIEKKLHALFSIEIVNRHPTVVWRPNTRKPTLCCSTHTSGSLF